MGELTIQPIMHAAVNSSAGESTTMPTKYFGCIVSGAELFPLLHTEYDNASQLIQVIKIAWNLLSGGKRGATSSLMIASRSMSGTTPKPPGHCIVSKRHKTLATRYVVDGRRSAITSGCRADTMMLFACRMSDVSGVQGSMNRGPNELGTDAICPQSWKTSSRWRMGRISELKTSTQKSGKPAPGAT